MESKLGFLLTPVNMVNKVNNDQQGQRGQHGQLGQNDQHGQRSRMLSSKLKDPNNKQMTAPSLHQPVRPMLSLPAYWHTQAGKTGPSCSVASQTSPQVAGHKRLQRSSASSISAQVPLPQNALQKTSCSELMVSTSEKSA